MSKQPHPILFRFRHDLRLSDNPGLRAAIDSGHPLVVCFILDTTDSKTWSYGGASRWWLHHSLNTLRKDIHRLGGQLILRSGNPVEQVTALARDLQAEAVYWSRGYEPETVLEEQRLHQQLTEQGIKTKHFASYLLHEPDRIKTQSGGPYKVFTPFWRACLQQPPPKSSAPTPKKILFHPIKTHSEKLEDWGLVPQKPDWSSGFYKTWTPGEQGAHNNLKTFLNGIITHYQNDRDRPGIAGTSKLSPHLHFGEISPRQIWHATNTLLAQNPEMQSGAETFLREIGWREFSYHLLHHWPQLPSHPFREQFAHLPWRKDNRALAAWQQGKTGYPLVDAGMRELWHTGWMHNRVRMIVASFLVKNLLIPWQEGEAWFWDTLVDADLASNAASWQWVAGSGADAAPYFRIFNSVTQGEKFDPQGHYIKHWLPELAKLPTKYIHQPWSAPSAILEKSGITLGKDYPRPIVDHKETRQRALDAYASVKY